MRTSVSQVAVDRLLARGFRCLKIAAGLFQVMKSGPRIPDNSGIAERLFTFKCPKQFTAGFLASLEFDQRNGEIVAHGSFVSLIVQSVIDDYRLLVEICCLFQPFHLIIESA